ncbi:MAG TPA: hypothetical protein VLW85_17360 [Myxococcales bacterium]|nr:hypothetical protein [Myxococcales bacterium]
MNRLSGLLFLLALVGCGGGSGGDVSLCDNLATAASAFAQKAAPCMSTPPQLGMTADGCRSEIGNCSSADQQRIRDFTSCLTQLPDCAPASASSWATSVQGCANLLGPLAGSGC